MTNAEANDVLGVSCARLAEHFEHVLILVSWMDEKGTRHGDWFTGNSFVLRDMAREFVAREERAKLAKEIRRQSEL